MWRQPPSRYLFRLISGLSPVKLPSRTSLAAIRCCTSNAAFVHTKQTLHQMNESDVINRPANESCELNAAKSEDLFRYTSGRWLVDEKAQQQLRFVKFDLDGLCRLAAACFGDATKCVRVVKLEGNFNKALLLTTDDGNEVIVKIPCPNAGPPSLTTASEVATLKFLRSRTSIRVPKIFAWSSDATNSVGAEFIIMEKITGVALAEAWEAMDTLELYKITDQVVQMEKELASMVFPAYGSLYLRDSLPAIFQRYPLSPTLDPEGLFCIGPSCNRTWWQGNSVDMSQPVPKDVGPWSSFSEYALSIPRREFAHNARSEAEVQRQLQNFDESQSIGQYESLLEKVNMILPILSLDPRVEDVSDPVLWHTDLHLGNIFVSPDKPGIIEGIIDWQSSQICPLFIQARFPELLMPPKDYTFGPGLPGLPDDFDVLSPEQQKSATNDTELASRSKYYEMSSLAYNKRVYDAMKLDRRLWESFTCCQIFSHGSLIPLRDCLIRLSQDWSLLGLPGKCPFMIVENERQKHDEQKVRYEDRLYLWDLVNGQLCTDNAGWVPNDRWEATEKANRGLYNMYIETMREELTPEAASKKWPFPPQPEP